MKNRIIRDVLLVIDFSDASWRDFASGFFDYASEHTHWNIRVRQNTAGLTNMGRTDGIVLCIRPSLNELDHAAAFSVPIILVGMDNDLRPGGHRHAVSIRNDNTAIGTFAAEYFLSLGRFASFGYVGMNDDPAWSRMRGEGFQNALAAENGADRYRSAFPEGSDGDAKNLAAWIRARPKPTALFAACDRRAIAVLEACRESGVAVPSQAVVLGVDDDRLLCDFASPPLTSVAPDHKEEGRTTARALEQLMAGHVDKVPKGMLITDKRIVERESTRPVAPVTALLRRAADFIAENAARNIGASDVARHLGVSRSLLDLRFREQRGETVAAAITTVRLDEVKRRLRKTRQSIRSIAKECGFSSANHLRNLFRRHFGVAMRDYRTTATPDSDSMGV